MKREWWYALILFVAFVALASYYLNTGGTTKPVKRASGRLSASLVDVENEQKDGPNKLAANSSQGLLQWGRNPFLTPEEEAAGGRPGAKGLDLKTIIVGDEKSVASLGGHTVSVGEYIGEEKVVEIRRHEVVLERNGRRRIIRAAELHRISAQIQGAEQNGKAPEKNENDANGREEVK